MRRTIFPPRLPRTEARQGFLIKLLYVSYSAGGNRAFYYDLCVLCASSAASARTFVLRVALTGATLPCFRLCVEYYRTVFSRRDRREGAEHAEDFKHRQLGINPNDKHACADFLKAKTNLRNTGIAFCLNILASLKSLAALARVSFCRSPKQGRCGSQGWKIHRSALLPLRKRARQGRWTPDSGYFTVNNPRRCPGCSFSRRGRLWQSAPARSRPTSCPARSRPF